jgi:hypothetical protein
MGFRTEKPKKIKSNRKTSWVMLAENGGYTPLPGEKTLYQSPPRTTLSLQTSHRHHPSESYSQQCKSGVVYLTNRRVRYPTHLISRSGRWLTWLLDDIPPRHPVINPPILRRPHTKRHRLARHSPLVRRQQMGSHHPARSRWRHTSPTSRTRSGHGVQGRRRIRLLQHIRATQRTLTAGCRCSTGERSRWGRRREHEQRALGRSPCV